MGDADGRGAGDRATRAAAIQQFAGALRELRRSVGDPSFREMAGRSRAISHTTLHEAAQGNRLPSWPTTVEFVKACGADPAEYRQRWQRADRAVRSAPSAPVTSAGAPVTTDPAGEPANEPVNDAANEPAVEPAHDLPPAGRGGHRRWRLALPAAVGAVVAGVVAGIVAWSTGDDHPAGGGKGSSTAPTLSAADCPVHQPNPPAASPAHEGDASEFVADVTLPDCTPVRRGATVTKTWRLRNVGTTTWRGYYLHRLELPQRRDQCQTITDVPIDVTPPGASVDISVDVTTPPKPAFCFVRFKMMDGTGRVVFPGHRPVNLQLIVG